MSYVKEVFGTDLFGKAKNLGDSTLAKKFARAPWSVLDMKANGWLKRKRAWRDRLGLKGEEGRQNAGEGFGKTFGSSLDGYGAHIRTKHSNKFTSALVDHQDKKTIDVEDTGTSVFDPVLCECMYLWFCLRGGSILDPFAGGSTRGLVANAMGYHYTGIEIRQNQIEANRLQATNIGLAPRWVHGDSMYINSLIKPGTKFDMLFTCPPYYDLEVYSIDNRDGSTHETYDDFIDWYYKIFEKCTKFLDNNRFAVVVVGEIRDKKTGAYRAFVPDTINVFLELGYVYYNELVLVTPGGSLPLRTGRQFNSGRKVGKTHQNILCFYKGDPTSIKDHFPKIEGL